MEIGYKEKYLKYKKKYIELKQELDGGANIFGPKASSLEDIKTL